ncbi:MAG: hypothetical protein WBP79_07125 [Candidatus Acidiferrales bacterium]
MPRNYFDHALRLLDLRLPTRDELDYNQAEGGDSYRGRSACSSGNPAMERESWHFYSVMYFKIKRVSSSVMVARTLMWRTIVAIMRGGNFGGAIWQRPQFDLNLFSPSIRADASARTGAAA